MRLTLIRFASTPTSTIGSLFVDLKFQCFTLEDSFQVEKIPGKTRIPSGQYSIVPRGYGGHSKLYKKKFGHPFVFEITGIPNFTDVLIHIGNTVKDTEGCILVGKTYYNVSPEEYAIGRSTEAYLELFELLYQATMKNSIELTIFDLDQVLKGG